MSKNVLLRLNDRNTLTIYENDHAIIIIIATVNNNRSLNILRTQAKKCQPKK